MADDKFWVPKPGEDVTLRLLPPEDGWYRYTEHQWPRTRVPISSTVFSSATKPRYYYTVLDHQDGKIKQLSVSENIHRQLQKAIEKQPKASWPSRLLAAFRLILESMKNAFRYFNNRVFESKRERKSGHDNNHTDSR